MNCASFDDELISKQLRRDYLTKGEREKRLGKRMSRKKDQEL
jgi:hypothetical protein